MTLEENTRSDETKDATKGTSDFKLWSTFVWKFVRSLAITLAGGTVIYLICRWLIY